MHSQKLDKNYTKAIFINRLNRFVGEVKLQNKITTVYIPNTGKLTELLIPGREVLLVNNNGKYKYKLLYIIYKGKTILIDSILSNRIFTGLLESKIVPDFTDFDIIKKEPAYKNHRFDFLVSDSCNNYYIELKSCTLAWKNIASFPDAVSERATNHIINLARSDMGVLVFLIFHEGIDFFIPNFHRDFSFYETLKKNHDKIDMHAYSIVQNDNYEIVSLKKVEIILPEKKPEGSYLLFLYNNENQHIEVGKLGKIFFPKGYYVYAGSAMNNVFKRIQRHRQKQKTKHWHIDYIKSHMKIYYDIPIIIEENIECQLAHMLQQLNGDLVERFGSSDCSCNGHLFHYEKNPLHQEHFMDKILEKWFSTYQNSKPIARST